MQRFDARKKLVLESKKLQKTRKIIKKNAPGWLGQGAWPEKCSVARRAATSLAGPHELSEHSSLYAYAPVIKSLKTGEKNIFVNHNADTF